MTLQQYVLQQVDNPKGLLICWLEADRVKVGDKVTLKNSEEPDQWWTVHREYNQIKNITDLKGAHRSEDWHKNDLHKKLTGLNTRS